MDQVLEDVCVALDDLSTTILNAWNLDVTMMANWGWNNPALTRHDLAAIPCKLAEQIRQISPAELSDKEKEVIAAIPAKITALKTTLVPYFFNGNGATAVPTFISTMSYFETVFNPLLNWEVLHDQNSMPLALSRRLRGIKANIDDLKINREELTSQIQLIVDATDAANSLPTDMASLRDAQKNVEAISAKSLELYSKIDNASTEAHRLSQHLQSKVEEANRIVEKCDDAYKITTTQGLAAAFAQRATKLGWSITVWVFGLILALGGGVYVGFLRSSALIKSLTAPKTDWGVILIELALTLISVAAPVWFAWISTKQISQRFRLAEDYAFKSSVAKAYEGYRKEAARIDQELEKRLFTSALSRLEEAPLRFIEVDKYGSPFHELMDSPAFIKAIEIVPELADACFNIAKSGTVKARIRTKKANQATGVETKTVHDGVNGAA